MVNKSLLERIRERNEYSAVEIQDILDIFEIFQQIIQNQEEIKKELNEAYITYENRYKDNFYPNGIDGICLKGRLYAKVSSFMEGPSIWEKTPDWEVWLRINEEGIEFGQGRNVRDELSPDPEIEITSTKFDFLDVLLGNIEIENVFSDPNDDDDSYYNQDSDDPIIINQNYENDEILFFFNELLIIPLLALDDLLDKINQDERDEDIYKEKYVAKEISKPQKSSNVERTSKPSEKEKDNTYDDWRDFNRGYYDWNSNFKSISKEDKDILKLSLGITAEDFKEYLKKWKKENST